MKCCVQQCSLWSKQASFKAFWSTTVRTHGVDLKTRLIQWRFQSSRLTFLANSALSCLTKQGFTVQWSLLIKLKYIVKSVKTKTEQSTLYQDTFLVLFCFLPFPSLSCRFHFLFLPQTLTSTCSTILPLDNYLFCRVCVQWLLPSCISSSWRPSVGCWQRRGSPTWPLLAKPGHESSASVSCASVGVSTCTHWVSLSPWPLIYGVVLRLQRYFEAVFLRVVTKNWHLFRCRWHLGHPQFK